MRRRLVAGNWKMNGSRASADVVDALAAALPDPGPEVLVCPPATLIALLAGRGVAIGAQDCHPDAKGAHTGDISAEMLRDAGAVAVILGHSERRADHGETDALVAAKTCAAWRAGLVAIVCVGETETERDAGRTLEVLGAQVAGSLPEGAAPERLVLAYEPIWAIGTGRTPGLNEIGEAHGFLRETVARLQGAGLADELRILYGGSVKAANAAEIFRVPGVDGALVGGASLAVADFAPIITAARGIG